MLGNSTITRLRDVVVESSPSEVLGITHLSSEKKRTDSTFCPFDTCKDCGCNGDCSCDQQCSRDCSCDNHFFCPCEDYESNPGRGCRYD